VPRNRVRHELLPYLEREFSPGIVEVLAREAALARDDDDRLEAEAIDLAASVVLTDIDPATGRSVPGLVQVEVQALDSLHPALGSRIARRALQYRAGERFIGFEHVHRFLDFVRSGEPGSAISLPGQQGLHLGRIVQLGPEPPRTARLSRAGENQFRIPLSIPGEVLLRSQQLVLSAQEWSGGSGGSGDLQAFVRGASGPLAVRSRKPGDRFQPPGLGGRSKKLQDYLVDRKVPRADRDFLPLVVDGDDRIVWVVGHGVAEGFRAPAPSPGVILLKARRLGGEV
jgi:tRNA(Ile)-lysidine synthase